MVFERQTMDMSIEVYTQLLPQHLIMSIPTDMNPRGTFRTANIDRAWSTTVSVFIRPQWLMKKITEENTMFSFTIDEAENKLRDIDDHDESEPIVTIDDDDDNTIPDDAEELIDIYSIKRGPDQSFEMVENDLTAEECEFFEPL